MARNLLQMFSVKCRHEFGWPRKTSEGDYYQVCLNCGEEYQYDWPTMRRLGKRTKTGQQAEIAEAKPRVSAKSSWSPRARRLKSPIEVQFRPQGSEELRPGVIENISQSGLFLKAEFSPAKDDVLEMIFEMPIEISGQRNAKVLCMGKVVRIVPQGEGETAVGFAVAILDYHFLHEKERKKPQVARRMAQKA